MLFPEYTEITPATLRNLQLALGLNNKAMAELIGVSEKTWLNRISAGTDTRIKLLSKLEYAYLKDMELKSMLRTTKSIDKYLNELQKSGMVIVGREHIHGLIAEKLFSSTVQSLLALMQQGRQYGIYFYRDQAVFDQDAFFHKLGEIGIELKQAKSIFNNLRHTPDPKLSILGDRD